MLHGCDGIQPFQERWAETLANSGYIALLVDDNGPIGVGNDCAHWPRKANNRSFDALGALVYLSGLPAVDTARIGALGWDTGGLAVMRVLGVGGEQRAVSERFAAGVALYPAGQPVPPMSAPLLILIGEKDDCNPAERVQHFALEDEPGPHPVRVEIIADAGHGFDDPRFREPTHFAAEQVQNCYFSGTTMAYSQAARDAAVEQARAFLEETLK